MSILHIRHSVVLSLVLLVAASPALAADQSMAPAESLDRAAPRIVNGTMTSLYPSTGALLTPGNPSSASLECSGTLIGCQTFLTAAHCVCSTIGSNCQGGNSPNPANFVVFLQHAGFFSVASITVRPDFNFPVGDVAVIKLASPVNGIAPSPINDTSAPPPGSLGTIVGFGRTGGGFGNADYGLKRVGKIVTATCEIGISNTTSVCWDFTDPLGPPGTDSNTCNGDSGGPLFIDFGTGDEVAGSTSGGNSTTCLVTDHSYDSNTFNYASWIQTQGGADLANTTCGDLPQVGGPGGNVLAASGSVSAGVPQGTHTFEVGSGTDVLRVAMNGVDDGSDFDLYVRAGSAPTTQIYDCAAAGPGQFAFCEFPHPTPGTWHVLVNRFSGGGAYQLTVTKFGLDCSDPDNDGLPCNDGNACTASDVCQSGTCAGTPMEGLPCDDGNLCTINDVCTNSVCAGVAMPDPTCLAPIAPKKALFQLTQRPVDSQDRLEWKWRQGAVTPRADFGDPLSAGGTSYALCVYNGAPGLILHAAMPAGGFCGAAHPRPCWRATSKGFQYADKDLTPSGISSVTLREGLTPGKASVLIKGRGPLLTMPAVPIVSLPVTVQLKNTAGHCWQATHGIPVTANDSRGFKAKNN